MKRTFNPFRDVPLITLRFIAPLISHRGQFVNYLVFTIPRREASALSLFFRPVAQNTRERRFERAIVTFLFLIPDNDRLNDNHCRCRVGRFVVPLNTVHRNSAAWFHSRGAIARNMFSRNAPIPSTVISIMIKNEMSHNCSKLRVSFSFATFTSAFSLFLAAPYVFSHSLKKDLYESYIIKCMIRYFRTR